MKKLKGTYLKMCFVFGVVTFSHLNLFAFSSVVQKEKTSDVLVFQSKINSLATIFSFIEEQTKFRIVYSVEDLDTSQMIHLNSNRIRLTDVLIHIEREKEIDYSISGKLISFKNRTASKKEKSTVDLTGQIRSIRGNVQDTQGHSLAYVLVRVAHSNSWILTDKRGDFVLQLEDGMGKPALFVESVGYETKEIQVTKDNHQQLLIKLDKENKSLDEIIITGYSSQVKADYTGAMAKIEGPMLQTLPQADIVDMLKGKAAGVHVFSENNPGGGNALAIRGLNTMNTNDPLILIDGIPVVNGLNTINPNDIETILILKDAEASIYGSRAANGVMLVTTKKANQTGEVVLEVNSYGGIQYVSNLPQMLNAREYGQMLWQAYQNDGVLPNHTIYGNNPEQIRIPAYLTTDQSIRAADVNWVKEIFTPARIQSHSFALSKGDSISQQRLGVGYFEQQGIIRDTYFKRLNARYNSNYHILDSHFTVGENFNISYAEQVEIGSNKALNSIVYDAYMYPSIIPVYDENGNFAGNPINDRQNPLGRLFRNKDNKRKEIRALGNLFAQATYGDFTFRTSLGLDFININSKRFEATFDELSVQHAVNALTTENRYNYQWVVSNTLNYKKRKEKHDLQVVLGQEAIQYYYEGFSASRDNFLQEDGTHWFLDYGTQNQLNSGNAYQWNLSSYFAKVNYTFNRKYLFAALMRRDGTSRLKNYRWSNFPALSVGWKMNEEDFWPAKVKENRFMLRLNWGISGNQQVPTYSTVKSFSHNNYNSNYDIEGSQNTSTTGLVSTRVANADLRWESTRQIDVGLEATFFGDKLQIALDYYTKKTKDLLVYRALPLTYGASHKGQWVNDGAVENKGVEMTAAYRNSFRELTYGVSLAFTSNKNRLTRLQSTAYLSIPSSSLHEVNFGQEVSRTMVGSPIGAFYGYVATGIFKNQTQIDDYGLQPNAQPGDLIFLDYNKDGVINHEDRTQIGTPHPKFTASLNIELTYKKFDLQLFWVASYGNDIYNLTKYQSHFFNQEAYNKSAHVLGAWTPSNPNSSIPRLTRDDPNNNIRPSSYYIEDGSFLKLSNVQVAYSFSSKRKKKALFKAFLQLHNVFTLTRYSGLSPEVGFQNYTSNNKSLDLGVDRGLYPPARTVSLGFTIQY